MAPDDTRWELWRQDDNGNRVLVRSFLERAPAEAELARFEALSHKQTYWIQERPLAHPGPAAG